MYFFSVVGRNCNSICFPTLTSKTSITIFKNLFIVTLDGVSLECSVFRIKQCFEFIMYDVNIRDKNEK